MGSRGSRGIGRCPNNFEKKLIKHDLKILRNGTASAIVSDHLCSIERQSVMASECVYTGATCGVVPVEPIHIYLSVLGA